MASAVIGALRANLSLNSAEFKKGMRAARQSMQGFKESMRDLARVAVGLSVSLGYIGTAAVDNAREVVNLSRTIGVMPDQFQRLAAAAKTVGFEQDKLADIFKDVNDKVGEFLSSGTGQLKDFFQNIAPKVGVTAAMFKKLSGPEALQLYYNSLEKAGVGQKGMTFYMEAISNDATRLIPLLRNNGEEFKRLGQKAADAGAIMSTDTIASLKKTGDSIDRIKMSFTSMRDTLAASLAPSAKAFADFAASVMGPGGLVRELLDKLAKNADRLAFYLLAAVPAFAAYRLAAFLSTVGTEGLAIALAGLKGALIRTGIGLFAVALGEGAYQMVRLKNATGSFATAFGLVGDLVLGVVNNIGAVWVQLGNKIVGVFRATFGVIWQILQGMGNIVAAIGETAINGLISAFETGLNYLIGRINWFVDTVNGLFAKLPDSLRKRVIELGHIPLADFGDPSNHYTEEAAKTGARIAKAFNDGMNSQTFNAPYATKLFNVDDVSVTWKKITSALSKTGDAAGDGSDAVARLKDELSHLGSPDIITAPTKAAKATSTISDAAKKVQRDITSMRDSLADVFSSIVTGSSKVGDALKGLLKQMASTVASNAFKSFFNSMTKGSGSGSWLGNAASFLFGQIGANANGTNNWTGGLTMVGERGPELLNLPRGSQIFDAQTTKSMVSGQGGVTRLEVSYSSDTEVRVLEKARSQSVSVTQSGINEFSKTALPQRVGEISRDPRRIG